VFGVGIISAQTSLQGKVTEDASGEPVIFGTVALYKNGVLITGTETDFDGNYFFSNLDAGTYDVEASYVGLTSSRVNNVVVKAGKTNSLNIALKEDGIMLEGVEIIEYVVPLIDKDNTSSGATVTAESIRSLPLKDINQIAATTAGIASQDGGDVSIRGSRTNETVYFIDGIRVRGGNLIPQSEIEQLQVITGGIEARYGDVTGGVISLTSKGPSDKFSGGVEVETSEFLDPYGYNLITGNLSGPILRNGRGESILGYRFSGQYRNIDETSPSAVGVYRAPESVIRELEANPLTSLGNSTVRSAEFLRNSDIGAPLDARPNETLEDLNVTGKLDAKISDAIDVSISGSFVNTTDRFTPGGSLSNSGPWYMYNWTRNPFSYQNSYRGNFRFRHKLGKQGSITKEEKEEGGSTNIRNLSYTIQLGYEKFKSRSEDLIHEDRFFDYGYIGKENYNWTPQILPVLPGTELWDQLNPTDPETGQTTINYINYHQAYTQLYPEGEDRLLVSPDYNPILGNYTENNGFLSQPFFNTVWSGLFGNVGQVYNSYAKNEQDVYSLNFASGFDFLPGGSEKGRHNIQFGFIYEQRVNRAWSISPVGLWQVGNDAANRHLIGIDMNNAIDSIAWTDQLGNQNLPVFGPQVNVPSDAKFYSEIRKILGKEVYEYVNISDLSPDQLSIDMFSASELNTQGVVNYYGYDYLGNKLGTDVKFDDFFTKDADGNRNFNVAPNQPIYFAGYVQDKFSFRDIIFSLGLRMDYYDANTKVLKDPYALYEIESASEFYDRTGKAQPSSVLDDYKVYVDSDETDNVVGFRAEDSWFDPSGAAVSGGNVLFGGGLVYPSYIGRTDDSRILDIQDEDFNTETSFEDYKPQINVMPRLAFSFPISDDAGFFMHYDILYQRPPSNTIATAYDYFYFNQRANANGANNPNLKPTRTVDYELGFQQKISNTSAIKISAYYKEIKDLVQQVVYSNLPAPVNTYTSYGNIDFSTVKGFSFNLDRRRTNNLQLTATYTLQFAEGSGSDANSSSGLNNRGVIRNLSPLNIDERHRITAVVDYRYGSGKRYNGPRISGVDIFENAGANFSITTVSGRPYTERAIAAQFGGSGYEGAINGNRLPWTFNIDARIDKSFEVVTSKETNKTLNFNVYLRVQNLLDTKNVSGFYSFSGDPDDDGYLLSQFGQDQLNTISAAGQDVDAFLDAYSWRLNAPGNYFFPRRIYLGATIDF
jgi:outer membrane receptor protein involved in Fe transport